MRPMPGWKMRYPELLGIKGAFARQASSCRSASRVFWPVCVCFAPGFVPVSGFCTLSIISCGVSSDSEHCCILDLSSQNECPSLSMMHADDLQGTCADCSLCTNWRTMQLACLYENSLPHCSQTTITSAEHHHEQQPLLHHAQAKKFNQSIKFHCLGDPAGVHTDNVKAVTM